VRVLHPDPWDFSSHIFWSTAVAPRTAALFWIFVYSAVKPDQKKGRKKRRIFYAGVERALKLICFQVGQQKSRIARLFKWCPEEDSNLHGFTR
jgi:hypothetical protein